MAKPKLTPLTATARSEFGKGAARRIRRAGDVPAVLYGHGTDPLHVTLAGQATFLALRQANVLLEINSDGAKPVMALPRQVQRNVITNFVEHVDLLLVREDEKVSVEVVLIITGEAERGSMVNQDLQSLTVLAPVVSIPEEIDVSVEGLEIGDQILVGDLKLPEGVVSQQDEDILVVNVTQPVVADLETEEDETEGEEGAEASAEDSEEA